MTGVKGIAVDDDGRLRCEQEVAGGRDVYVVADAGRGERQGGHQPARATRRCRGGCGPSASRSSASTPARPASRLEMVRLVLPPGSGKQVEVLGNGPEAAPAVVGVLNELGVL